MFKFKCKSCGKIHETKPETCSCGGAEFAEIEVVIEKQEVNTDEIKANAIKEYEAELAKKNKKIQEDIALAQAQKNMTDEQIEISNLKRILEEQNETINFLKDTTLKQAEEVKSSKIKEEINKRVEKEPYLKEIVGSYLEAGVIKTLEDYDRLITASLRKTYKEKAEFEALKNSLGTDPASEYIMQNGVITTATNKDWKEMAKASHQEAVNKMLGIKPAK